MFKIFFKKERYIHIDTYNIRNVKKSSFLNLTYGTLKNENELKKKFMKVMKSFLICQFYSFTFPIVHIMVYLSIFT